MPGLATGILSIDENDLAPIRPLLAALYPGLDLTRLGSWCILPLCCGAIAGQALSTRMQVFEAIQSWDTMRDLIAGKMPPDVLAHTFAALLKARGGVRWDATPAETAASRTAKRAAPAPSARTRLNPSRCMGFIPENAGKP